MLTPQFDFNVTNPYNLTFADYRNNPQIKALATDIIGWLYRFTSFIEKGYAQRTRQFTPVYNETTTSAIVNKEWATLVQYDLPYVRNYHTEVESNKEAIKFEAAVTALKDCIKNLEFEFNDPKIFAKQKTFTLKQGIHPIDGFKESFQHTDNLYIRAFLNTIERFLYVKTAFDATKILESIDTYVELMHSLKTPGAMGLLTPTVSELMETAEYFTRGYPKDLFCFDKRQLQTSDHGIEFIYAHKERCTTFASTKEEPIKVSDEYFVLFDSHAGKHVPLKKIA
jgi:hypothetical protein